MRIEEDFPQIAAYVVHPEPEPNSPGPPGPVSGEGKVIWASPDLAKALGGSSLGRLSGTARIYPVQPEAATVSQSIGRGVQFFDDAGISLDDVLKGIVEDSVKNRHLSAAGGTLFKSTIAGAEIVLELTNPSDKSALEKALSISLNALTVLEPLTDWVPHLTHAKSYLLAIVDIGGQVLAAVHTPANDAGAALKPA